MLGNSIMKEHHPRRCEMSLLRCRYVIVAPSATGKTSFAWRSQACDLDGDGEDELPVVSWPNWFAWLRCSFESYKNYKLFLVKTGVDADATGVDPQRCRVVIPSSRQHSKFMERRGFTEDTIAEVKLERQILRLWAVQRRVDIFTSITEAVDDIIRREGKL